MVPVETPADNGEPEVHEWSVTDATHRGVAGLVSDAEGGTTVVVTRHRRPVAAIVSMERLAAVEELRQDLRDLALVVSRQVTDTGVRTDFDEVLTAFGHTRESLGDLPD